MLSDTARRRIWLVSGVLFLSVSVLMLLGAPALASVTGTRPFSGVGGLALYREMEKNEILIKLGVPAGLAFAVLQYSHVAMGHFEFVVSKVIWGALPLAWSLLCLVYLCTSNQIQQIPSRSE